MSSLDLFRTVTDTLAYAAGETVFEEGEPGDVMYLVKEGRVNVMRGEQVINTIKPGGIFGEMTLIGSEPRSATAVAVTDCQLLPVDEERFLFLVQQTPYFSLHVMRVLADRLRDSGSPSH